MNDVSCPSGPALLVPMTLEAVVITGSTEDGKWRHHGAWAWNLPSYAALESLDPVDPQPLSESPPSLAGHRDFAGVVLHWALPDALTHGVETGDEIVYPPIPNRWLVVRKTLRSDGAASDGKAWVVVSDELRTPGDGLAPEGAPYPPQSDGDAADHPARTTLGAAYELSHWPPKVDAGKTLDPPLTALGPGDPSFAANVPRVQNVLSFADALKDVVPGSVTYSVYGWYAAERDDPLAAHRYPESKPSEPGHGGWLALMEHYRWTVAEPDARLAAAAWAQATGIQPSPGQAENLPMRTLLHGLLFDVKWPGREGRFVSGVPRGRRTQGEPEPQVAIANSPSDALAAMLAPEGDEGYRSRRRILEAFQRDALPLLDEVDGPARVFERVQAGWFADSDGGSRWIVEDPGGATAVELSEEQSNVLTELNVQQRELDRTARRLASRRWQRHAYGVMRRYAASSPHPSAPEWFDKLEQPDPGLDRQVELDVGRWEVALRERDINRDNLKSLQRPADGSGDVQPAPAAQGGPPPERTPNPLPPGAVLTEVPCPPFHSPHDPVILVNGVRRSHKHGEDGRFSATGDLICRFSGQTVVGITTAGATPPAGANGEKPPLANVARPGLPPEIADLELEAFYLDPLNARWIAQRGAPAVSSEEVARLQTSAWNAAATDALDLQVLAENGGMLFAFNHGAMPSKIGVEAWAPPWTPLYLEWRVEVFPTATDPALTLDDERWVLAPHGAANPSHDMSYIWDGGAPLTTTSFFVSGRSLLAPQASDLLAARIEQAIDRAHDGPGHVQHLKALREALQYAASADLLAQSLTGFHAALLDRGGPLFPGIGGAAGGMGSGGPAFSPPDGPRLTSDPACFRAVRACHCRIDALRAVDAFGQVFDVLGAIAPKVLAPRRGTDLETPGDERLVALKPRITQRSRIALDLLDASDDGRELGLHHGANPVCGWLIPNHLDRSLLVYDADGSYAGELGTNDAGGQTFASEGGSGIENAHLKRVVDAIAAEPDRVTAVRALAEASEIATAAARASEDDELQLLAGYPLAVVRCRLRLELDGRLAVSQAWGDIGARTSKGYEKVKFPIQVGSTELAGDGVAGYWIKDNYKRIHSVLRTDTMPRYVGTRSPVVGFPADDDDGDEDGRQGRRHRPEECVLTLLLDPSLDIHVVSGVLPVLTVTVPRELAMPDLTRVQVTFRVGPILDVATGAGVTLPLPATREGNWSWLQVDDAATAVAMPAIDADPMPALPDGLPQLRSGWLRLSLAERDTRLTYSAAPAVLPCGARDGAGGGAGTSVQPVAGATIEVSAYNATRADVTCTSLMLDVAAAENATALTRTPASIRASVSVPGAPAPWNVVADGAGGFIASPPAGSGTIAAGTTLTFSLTGIVVDDEPGTASVTVTEVAAGAGQSEATSETFELAITKIAVV
jgi:hypothetical protein